MKKKVFLNCVLFILLLIALPAMAQPLPAYRGDYGGWCCPYCGQYQGPWMGRGMMGRGFGMGPGGMMGYGFWGDIAQKLPAPKNQEWIQSLREVLALELLSYAQYTADAEKFNVHMPYMMVIPQEEYHIETIKRLFVAYGLPSDVKIGAVTETKTLPEAYELCIKMERDLIPRYELLVKNAEDRDTTGILNTLLLQTRHHLVMFEHALQMGGRGMGPGYGYGFGRGMMRGW